MHERIARPGSPYARIYAALRQVRDAFHRTGRIGDANAKLDEIVKLLAVHFSAADELISREPVEELLAGGKFSVPRLNELFVAVAHSPPFLNGQGGSIFGQRPGLAFEPGDEAVAHALFHAAAAAFDAHGTGASSLDALNEAFGHFVRDSFRNDIEDAQYMTPPEVVDFMVGIASIELDDFGNSGGEPFVMLDPSCGVGTFMTAWRREYERKRQSNADLPPLLAVGQDKVERMVRLAALNLIFAHNDADRVSMGNSLSDDSPLNAFNGRVDLILTNPPFGAKFAAGDVRLKGRQATPIFANSPRLAHGTVDSELLFIDRYVSLLRPGGLCLAIVPDSVISATGLAAYLRQQLVRQARLLGVIELPSVTFAQAGTRTKTAILFFEKSGSTARRCTGPVFFAEADDLGFDVSKRKGVTIKRQSRDNQLPDILDAYRTKADRSTDRLQRPVTAVWRDVDPADCAAWTPRQFRAAPAQERRNDGAITLADLVEPAAHRKPAQHGAGELFISVLHVVGEGLLDVDGVKAYRPITPGVPVSPGEVIISRINPRIPRVLVVPDLGHKLLCSMEFEILTPRRGVRAHALAHLLLLPGVQRQIHALTAGTSASHSRVKPGRIRNIRVPWPEGPSRVAFDRLIDEYAAAMSRLMDSLLAIHALREQGNAFLDPASAEPA